MIEIKDETKYIRSSILSFCQDIRLQIKGTSNIKHDFFDSLFKDTELMDWKYFLSYYSFGMV